METGTVKLFKAEEGFGFITPDVPHPDGRDVFVYYSSILMPGFRKLVRGQRVRFEMGASPDGRPQAVSVEILLLGSESDD